MLIIIIIFPPIYLKLESENTPSMEGYGDVSKEADANGYQYISFFSIVLFYFFCIRKKS